MLFSWNKISLINRKSVSVILVSKCCVSFGKLSKNTQVQYSKILAMQYKWTTLFLKLFIIKSFILATEYD